MPKAPKGRKPAGVRSGSQSGAGNSSGKSRSPLPDHYNFTPPEQIRPQLSPPPQQPRVLHTPSASPVADVSNYPPPQALFQDSSEHRRQHHPTLSMDEPHIPTTSRVPDSESPVQASRTQSQPSSQGTNFFDEAELVLPELPPEMARALNSILCVPEREKFTTVLSPIPKPNTTWFTRDKRGQLVRRVTKVFTNKFDGPYYSWSVVPRERQQRYFLEFAKTHTWDPLISGTVQWYFESICQRRMKDMVSSVRTSRVRPPWIIESLWKTMVEYWDTEDAKRKSEIYSSARMSDRGGLGPHIHLSGPKSYQQIKQDMEEELGREVSLGEVFIRTHTKKDGTFVDRKAEQIVQTYEKNLHERMTQVEAQNSTISDGASQVRELTVDDHTSIFLQSTEKDSRGNLYGLGSLKDNIQGTLTGTSNNLGHSSSILTLQEQLKEAQRKIEEQASRFEEQAAREAEYARVVTEQKGKLKQLSLVEKYLRQTDPAFLDFMAAQETDPPTPTALDTSP